MKTLLIDGEWNLKRNFYKRKFQTLKGERSGGTFGFLDSLRSCLNKILPDRVIVCWDGYNSGKYRYEIYPYYKANRKKKWDSEDRIILTSGDLNPADKEKYDILVQKVNLKNYLEELYIRQIEMDYIEADDLIAGYILESQGTDEEVVILTRDGDFKQLISDRVSIINPDNLELITIENFESIFGYTVENELLFKCFEGDSSDNIKGVKGVTRNNLIKYFPDIKKEKYFLKRLIDESYEKLQKKKNNKTLQNITQSSDVVYRNARLMNLKKPFLTIQATESIRRIKSYKMSSDRNIEYAMERFIRDGFIEYLNGMEVEIFFSPYYVIMSKEKEYAKNFCNK